jgi:hypothetical protein
MYGRAARLSVEERVFATRLIRAVLILILGCELLTLGEQHASGKLTITVGSLLAATTSVSAVVATP